MAGFSGGVEFVITASQRDHQETPCQDPSKYASRKGVSKNSRRFASRWLRARL
jgi:hypothetical protein